MICKYFMYCAFGSGFEVLMTLSLNPRISSPGTLLERPPQLLSTFRPSRENVKTLKDGAISVRLLAGEVSSMLRSAPDL